MVKFFLVTKPEDCIVVNDFIDYLTNDTIKWDVEVDYEDVGNENTFALLFQVDYEAEENDEYDVYLK